MTSNESSDLVAVEQDAVEQSQRPCAMCNKMLSDVFEDDWKSVQPIGGGEMRLVFSFGSKKFDNYASGTSFSGLICDQCAEKLMPNLEDVSEESPATKKRSDQDEGVAVEVDASEYECDGLEVGDMVRHKASGELGIVVAIGRACYRHTGIQHAMIGVDRMNGKDRSLTACVYESTGEVTLSIGLEKQPITVAEMLLELVPSDD